MAPLHTDEEVEQVVAQVRASNDVAQISNELLTDRDAHWAERDAALQRLGELLQAGALNPSASDFASSLKAMLSGIVTQLPDLRSQVARSACSTLMLLAAEVGDHAALDRPMREQVLPAVIALISNGNKVLATAGRECLPTLTMYCHFDGMLKVLASAVTESRHISVRHACLNSLNQALQYWPVQVLGAVGGLLEKALVPAATDAAHEVRALARQCLVQYQLAFPERAQHIDSRLDSPTRRKVKEETRDVEGHGTERHVLSPAARRTTAKASTALAASGAHRPGSRPTSRPQSGVSTAAGGRQKRSQGPAAAAQRERQQQQQQQQPVQMQMIQQGAAPPVPPIAAPSAASASASAYPPSPHLPHPAVRPPRDDDEQSEMAAALRGLHMKSPRMRTRQSQRGDMTSLMGGDAAAAAADPRAIVGCVVAPSSVASGQAPAAMRPPPPPQGSLPGAAGARRRPAAAAAAGSPGKPPIFKKDSFGSGTALAGSAGAADDADGWRATRQPPPPP